MTSVSNLRLIDIASSQVFTVAPETLLEEAIASFAERHISSLVVVEGGKPIGIVTERDLVRLMCLGMLEKQTVRAVMSTPLLTVRFDLDFSSAQLLMANHGIRHLVLVDDDGVMQGLASETDFRQYLDNDIFNLIQTLNTVMDQGVNLIDPARPLAFALQVMYSARLDHIIVGTEERADGILTERDVPRLLDRHVDPQLVTLAEVMTQPLVSIPLETPVAEAARQMEISGLRHLMVINGKGALVGVVSQHRMLEKLGVVLLERSRAQLEDRMDMVLEATGVGTWEYDHRRGELIRSSALNGMLRLPQGQSREVLDSVLERIDPEDRACMAACFREFLEGRTGEFSQDYRVLGGDGQVRWMSSRGRVVEWDSEGKPLRSLGVAIDISAQKASEQSLRVSEARLRGLMENVSLPLCQVNAREELVFINHHFTEEFGYRLEDIPNLAAWWVRAYPDEAYRAWVLETWNEALEIAALSHQRIRPLEYRVTCKNGTERIVEISGVILGEDFLATFVDVTERRQEQALLEFSNAILQRVSTGAPLADVLDFIAREIETQDAAIHCTVLLVDESGRHLHHGAAPSLPHEYCAAIDGEKIGPAAGSCGTAAYLGEEVFVADIANNPLWAGYKELALKHGLAACWSSPIQSSASTVLGTFAVYWASPQPDISTLVRRYVAIVTKLAAIAIESAQRETKLRNIYQGLSRAETIGRLGSWTWKIGKAKGHWSSQMFSLFGLDATGEAPDVEQLVAWVHPDDQAQLREAVEKMNGGQTPSPFTFRRHPALGALCYLQPSFSPLLDDKGVVDGFEGTVIDVTVSRQSEERLRGQLEELRRWQQVTLGREGRVLELKREVNALLSRLGEAPRYVSVMHGGNSP